MDVNMELPKGSVVTEIPEGMRVSDCKYCGHPGQLLAFEPEYCLLKVVCCTNAGDEHERLDACPFYLPPPNFFKPSEAEAVTFWNEYPTQLNTLVQTNGEVTSTS